MPAAMAMLAITQGARLSAQFPPMEEPSQPFDAHDISGYWELGVMGDRSVPAADLTPDASAKMASVVDEDRISDLYCRPLGVPASMDPGRPLSIMQGRFEVLITAPVNTEHRHLYFRDKHTDPEIYDPSSTGESIAHWEGDTLVVDTIGFHAKDGRQVIPGGGYRTADSHLVERYKLLKKGRVLSVTFTWTDPKVFATPHTYEFWYHKISGNFEQLPGIGCSAWDMDRRQFLEATFSPELKKKAEEEMIEPGSPRAAAMTK